MPDTEDGGAILTVDVLIEIPKGSRNKYEFDKERNVFKLDRMLFSSMHYPSDYGFITETLAEDGDALDAMVLIGEPTFPGCLIEARPIGLFKMRDEKGLDYKILCVPLRDPQWNHIHKLADVPPHLLIEIEHFFDVYKELEKKKTAVEGWEDAGIARRVIEEARERFLSLSSASKAD
ncbi:MAG: inorganic diphosphatase [Candidatus Aminicenantes bacterium]|nr:inorganic diphosphatase [Candidatus Aminicenantes bacterium]